MTAQASCTHGAPGAHEPVGQGPEIEHLLHSSVGPQHKTFRARYNAHANPCATGAHYARARSDAHAIL